MLTEWPVTYPKADESFRAMIRPLATAWQRFVSGLSMPQGRSFSVPPLSDAWLRMHEAEYAKRGDER